MADITKQTLVYLSFAGIIIILLLGSTAMNNKDAHTDNYIVITNIETGNVYKYRDLKNRQIIFENPGKISVSNISDDKIVLQTSGFVEPNEDGTINLLSPKNKKISININNSATFISQTMDSGLRLKIEYKSPNAE